MQAHATQQEERPTALGYTSAQTGPLSKNRNYENRSTAVPVNKFEHLMMTISLETCVLMRYGEILKGITYNKFY
jgi:hypothetical protein